MINLKLLRKVEKKVFINVRLYKSTHEKLIKVCEEEQITLNALIRHLINSFLEDRENATKVAKVQTNL